jgi:hypothetical protein
VVVVVVVVVVMMMMMKRPKQEEEEETKNGLVMPTCCMSSRFMVGSIQSDLATKAKCKEQTNSKNQTKYSMEPEKKHIPYPDADVAWSSCCTRASGFATVCGAVADSAEMCWHTASASLQRTLWDGANWKRRKRKKKGFRRTPQQWLAAGRRMLRAQRRRWGKEGRRWGILTLEQTRHVQQSRRGGRGSGGGLWLVLHDGVVVIAFEARKDEWMVRRREEGTRAGTLTLLLLLLQNLCNIKIASLRYDVTKM